MQPAANPDIELKKNIEHTLEHLLIKSLNLDRSSRMYIQFVTMTMNHFANQKYANLASKGGNKT